MHINQIRDEGLAKHDVYLQDATSWRQARDPQSRSGQSAVKRLQSIWLVVVNLLWAR